MTRAQGKHNRPRQPEQIYPETPQADEIGFTGRQQGDLSPIPGGNHHITNAPTVRQSVPVAEPRPEHHGILAHGVPPDTHTFRERADLERGPDMPKFIRPQFAKTADRPAPVPVYIVASETDQPRLETIATDKFTIPATGTAAVRIAGRDPTRTHVSLLVETAAGAGGAAPSGIRFDHELGNLDVNQGALLRAGGTSYFRFHCQDELFAVSNDGSAVTLSVVYEYGVPGAQ